MPRSFVADAAGAGNARGKATAATESNDERTPGRLSFDKPRRISCSTHVRRVRTSKAFWCLWRWMGCKRRKQSPGRKFGPRVTLDCIRTSEHKHQAHTRLTAREISRPRRLAFLRDSPGPLICFLHTSRFSTPQSCRVSRFVMWM